MSTASKVRTETYNIRLLASRKRREGKIRDEVYETLTNALDLVDKLLEKNEEKHE
jgi:hypothetical protein